MLPFRGHSKSSLFRQARSIEESIFGVTSQPSNHPNDNAYESDSFDNAVEAEYDEDSDSSLDSDGDISNHITLDDMEEINNDYHDELFKNWLKEQLQQWSITHNITHSAIHGLLLTLQSLHTKFKPDKIYQFLTDLPRHPRTLLHTNICIQNDIIAMPNEGKYYYKGIYQGIAHQILRYPYLQELEKISMQFSIDGVPIYNHSKQSFWPISALIESSSYGALRHLKPFLVALYNITGKPYSLEAYLQPFIDELNRLQSDGIKFNGEILPFSISAFTCDAPARSFIRCTIGSRRTDLGFRTRM